MRTTSNLCRPLSTLNHIIRYNHGHHSPAMDEFLASDLARHPLVELMDAHMSRLADRLWKVIELGIAVNLVTEG
jgi:hypothetical protein